MVKGTKEQVRRYGQRVQRHKPKPPVLRNVLAAFLTGGMITAAGQLVLEGFVGLGMTVREAATPTAGVMIFIGALLTGLGVYDRLGRWGGMGAALPITGFANAIVAPAMEYKREGYVLGVGSRMFSIAGPVIVYALVVSIAGAAVRFFWVGP